MSWRDSASQEAQEDLDGLLDAALPFAQQRLEKDGAFFPYGAAIDDAGETHMVAADPNQGERPSSAAVLDLLVEGLRRDRESLRAVALVSDVRVAGSDAIRVELEHREGATIAVFLPYTRKRIRRGVDFGDLVASQGHNKVWTI